MHSAAVDAPPPLVPRAALLVIVLALALYAVLTLRAALTLSPTYDEPLHAASAWNMRFANDLRLNDEDPAFWQQFVSLFLRPSDLPRSLSDAEWASTAGGVKQADEYFRATIPFQPRGLILHARLASVVIALGLGVSLAFVAWRLAGPVAAAAAAVLFSLEPLLLGHGPLVKNDIAIALCFLWAAYLARDALAAKWTDVLPLIFTLAIAPLVKFSGFLLWIAIGVTLLYLAWRGGLRRHLVRLVALAAATLGAFFAFTWLAYGLRFAPGPKGETFDVPGLLALVRSNDLRARTPGLDVENPPASAAEPPNYALPLPVRAAAWAEAHCLLPQAYCSGFIYTFASSLYRRSLFLGQQGALGWPLYFPVAWLVKTPVTLVALSVAAALFAWRRRRCPPYLLIPAAIYLAASMSTRLNIGLRHLLPIYPLLLLGLSIVIAAMFRALPRRRFAVLAALLVGVLAAEVLPFSNRHLSYFNLPARLASRNGLTLLGDSNLDWGQETYRLAEWQRQHPDTRLYTYLFTAPLDLASAGVRSIDAVTAAPGQGPGVLAISATRLQGIYATGERSRVMARWREAVPDERLGDTLYLFSVNDSPTLGSMR